MIDYLINTGGDALPASEVTVLLLDTLEVIVSDLDPSP